MTDIARKILLFYDQLRADEHHRYKSWEHCYSYFSGNEVDDDYACLHLSFYLASWGMYRGSSFLLWKDYLIHKEVVNKILTIKKLNGIEFIGPNDPTIKDIINLVTWIKSWYRDNISHVNGRTSEVNVTDTLATKIILGTLGCIPAYDRYFIDGLRHSNIGFSYLNEHNLRNVVGFYLSHMAEFKDVQAHIHNVCGIIYPPMKLVDMYFWQIGYEKDQ